jgi:hypothetical protein
MPTAGSVIVGIGSEGPKCNGILLMAPRILSLLISERIKKGSTRCGIPRRPSEGGDLKWVGLSLIRSAKRLALSGSTPRGRPLVDRFSLLPKAGKSKRDAKSRHEGADPAFIANCAL